MADPVQDYLDSHSLLTLATASKNGIPHAAPVIYVNDGTTVFFSIAPGSTSAANLTENPVAAIGVADNPDDWNAAQGAQLAGNVTKLSGDDAKKAAGLFSAALLEPRRRGRFGALLPPPTPRRALRRQQVELGREERGARTGVGHERRAPRVSPPPARRGRRTFVEVLEGVVQVGLHSHRAGQRGRSVLPDRRRRGPHDECPGSGAVHERARRVRRRDRDPRRPSADGHGHGRDGHQRAFRSRRPTSRP